MKQKPAHGTPCNNCGVCCMIEVCPLGQAVFKILDEFAQPCPGLEPQTDGGYLCGLVANPQTYAPIPCIKHGTETMRDAAKFLTGFGIGCDASAVDEERDIEMDNRIKARHTTTTKSVARRYILMWAEAMPWARRKT